jgi:hypothetical protein
MPIERNSPAAAALDVSRGGLPANQVFEIFPRDAFLGSVSGSKTWTDTSRFVYKVVFFTRAVSPAQKTSSSNHDLLCHRKSIEAVHDSVYVFAYELKASNV